MSNTTVPWAKTLELLPENAENSPGISQGIWDFVILGGVSVPGVARVTVDAGMGLDVQKSKGGKGAIIQDNGDPPAKVKIEFLLQGGDLQEFRDNVVPLLRPRDSTTGRPPLEIIHPQCELWGITRVIVGDISSGMPKPGGQMSITVNAVEWDDRFKPVKVQKSIKGSDSDSLTVRNTAGTNIFDPQAPTGVDAIPTTDQLLSSL